MAALAIAAALLAACAATALPVRSVESQPFGVSEHALAVRAVESQSFGKPKPQRRALRVAHYVQQKFDDMEHLKKQLDDLNKENERKVPKVPKRLVEGAKRKVDQMIGSLEVTELGGCADKVSVASLGLRRSKRAAAAWKNPSLLQTSKVNLTKAHPGEESFSVPGAGVDQVLKDDGLSENGKVDGQAPFVKVLKDGFFEVGCYHDSMLEYGDKYGNNADQYREDPEKGNNVSIAKYKELVMEDEQKSMTPILCFEFCRTLPDMVFFGVANGDDCYCTPYFKAMPADDKQCTVPCAGDTSQMCGNDVKSTIFEMHLCADTATVLQETMVSAKAGLDFYFENIVLGGQIASQMTRSGIALEKLAGLSGAPGARENGQAAMKASKPLSQAYQEGKEKYQLLLGAYKDAIDAKAGDISDATTMAKAEESIRVMKATTGPVVGLADEVHDLVKAAYPAVDQEVFGDDPDPDDAVAKELADAGSSAGFDFRPATYAYSPDATSVMSSCNGPIVGVPMVGLGLPQCAKVCEATVYPENCVAFSWYMLKESETMEDGSGLSDLCVMISDIKTLETFSCPPEESLLQVAKVNETAVQKHKLGGLKGLMAEVGGGRHREPEAVHASAECMVKMSEVSTGYKPKNNAKWEKYERCFGATSDEPASLPEAYKTFKMPAVAEMEDQGKDAIAPPP